MRLRNILAAAALGVLARGAAPAHANGRAPVTNGITFDARDNRSLYVRSTFGLLVSHDDGCSFRWLCEQSIGYGGVFDPTYAVGPDGTLYATTYEGLRVSRDGGCTFTTATAELPAGTPGRVAGVYVDAISIGPTGDIWIATADTAQANDLYRSTDAGHTFASAGTGLPALWWKSIAVSPANPAVAFATGYQVATATPTGQAFVTRDTGATWNPLPLTGVQRGPAQILTVLALDGAAPERLFLDSVGANGSGGDRLYRTTDGGDTFTEVLATTQPIVDVVLRDGGGVIVVSGEGTYRSTDGGASFDAGTPVPKLGCLGTRPDGTLVGCAANWDPDFMAVASSSDGAQFAKVMRFAQLAGPLTCPAGTPSHDMCDPLWPALQQQFGATGPTNPACAAPAEAPLVEAPLPPTTPGGCCETSGGSSGSGGSAALLAGLLAIGFVSRRRRGS